MKLEKNPNWHNNAVCYYRKKCFICKDPISYNKNKYSTRYKQHLTTCIKFDIDNSSHPITTFFDSNCANSSNIFDNNKIDKKNKEIKLEPFFSQYTNKLFLECPYCFNLRKSNFENPSTLIVLTKHVQKCELNSDNKKKPVAENKDTTKPNYYINLRNVYIERLIDYGDKPITYESFTE
jgi:hypothetical protein